MGFILLCCHQGNRHSCCCLGGCPCSHCALPMCISPGALLVRLLLTMCFRSGCWLLSRVGIIIQSGLSGWLVVLLVVGISHGYLMVLGWAGSWKKCVCAMVYLSEVTVGVNHYRYFIGTHGRHCCMWLLPLLAPVSTVGNLHLVVVTDQGAPVFSLFFLCPNSFLPLCFRGGWLLLACFHSISQLAPPSAVPGLWGPLFPSMIQLAPLCGLLRAAQ